MRNSKAIIFAAFICPAVCGLALADAFLEPTIANLNNDDSADFSDFGLFANNWQQTGEDLAGDFDDSNTIDTDDLMVFCWYWLFGYSEYQHCLYADLDNDGVIAFEDVAKLAQNWLLSGEGLTGDFDDSNLIDYNDLSIMAGCWLAGSRPEGIWEQFKAALAAGDANTALNFISETSKDTYAEVFQIIEPDLPAFAAGMGDLIFDSQEEAKVKYEMTHQVGEITYLFPVIFIKDDDGNWRIFNF